MHCGFFKFLSFCFCSTLFFTGFCVEHSPFSVECKTIFLNFSYKSKNIFLFFSFSFPSSDLSSQSSILTLSKFVTLSLIGTELSGFGQGKFNLSNEVTKPFNFFSSSTILILEFSASFSS
ncbi:hypothetical protein Hanom_Chr02g00121441 [Helianthus anomalus]